MTDSTERSRNDYKAMQEELRVAEGDAEWSRDETEDEGDMETYAEEVSNRMVYQSAIRSYNDMIDSLDDYSSTKSQRTQEKQLTNSAQSLMISYQSLINAESLSGGSGCANISFDAARTGLDSARITWENAQKKYSMGMLSRTDYLQEQSSYIQKEFAFQTAELSLFQAMENYYWGVNGVMTLS